MQATIWAAAAMLTLGVMTPTARADVETSVQKTLQADYNERDSAYVRKDIQGTMAHYAPDFVGVSTTGMTHDLKVERADFLKTFTTLKPKASITKSTIQKLALSKGNREATVTIQRHGILLFANPQTGLNDVLVLDGVFQDVWAKRAGEWRLTREQASAVKATMNGRPL